MEFFTIILAVGVIIGAVGAQNTCTKGEASGSSVASQLVNSLIATADPNTRPDADYGGPTVVQQAYLLLTFDGPTPGTQNIFHSHGVGVHSWKDSRLAWNPSEYAGITSINLPNDKIWFPDLVVHNTVGASASTYGEQLTFPVNVSSDGTVTFRTIGDFDLACTRGSDGSVTCPVFSGAWVSDTTMLQMATLPVGGAFGDFSLFQATEWAVKSNTVEQVVLRPPCCSPNGYSVNNYTAVLTPINSAKSHIK